MSEQVDIRIDTEQLCREETYTDQQVGSIRKLIPVTPEGEDDSSREVAYFGTAHMMTPAGALPLNFEIEASSLKEAVEGFPPAAEKALERAVEELKEMQREASSRIMVPGQGGNASGGSPSGMGGGGMPGGGIQLG